MPVPATLRRLAAVLGAFSLLGCHKTDAPPAKSWYDAEPLLASVRPDQREVAKRATEPKSLTDLPLYDLAIDLSDDLGELDLTEKVYFTNTFGAPLGEVALRIYANATGEQHPVELVSGACFEGPSCKVSAPAPSVVVATLAEPVAVGKRVRIDLRLRAKLGVIEPGRTSMLAQGFESLQRMKGGKGAGDYGLLARGDDIASVASFYPVLARFSDGKWEKSDASTMGDLGASGMSHVIARVTVPADAEVVSSGVVTKSEAKEAEAGARKQLTISAAFIHDFAMLVSRNFQSASRKVGDVEVRSHYLGRDERAGRRVLDAAAASLASYEKLFGRYPYVDLDVVEAPLVGGAGGVEFSGLVTVASMLYRPALSEGPMGALMGLFGGPSQKEIDGMTDSMLEFVTAHEVAHQYWPGLVGSDSRQHPWMDESLAQWSAVMYVRDRYGADRAKQEAEREILANYQTMRLLGTADGAVDRPVDAFGGELAYAGLVYGKGPYLFRELEKKLGEEQFAAGLRRYIERNRYRSAPPRGLIEELAKGNQADEVRALAKRWLDEKHGDEDLGKPDLRQMLAGWIGEDAVKNMGPELDMAMKLMMKLLGPDSGGADNPLQLLDLLAPKQ
jgi:hypothetical protein